MSDFARMRFPPRGDLELLTMPVDLKSGVEVQAHKNGSQWVLLLSVPGSQRQETLPGVGEPVVRAAFYDSCQRQLFKQRRALTVHDEPKPEDPVELPAGTALVVTDAYQSEGELYWTVEDQQRELGNEWPGGSAVLPLRYTISAKELTAAATRA